MAGVVPVPDQPHLPNGVQILKCQVRGNMEGQEQTVYLVGTAHVSTSSASDARAVIRAVRPQVSRCHPLRSKGTSRCLTAAVRQLMCTASVQVVMLELCRERMGMLQDQQSAEVRASPLRPLLGASP